MPLEWIGGITVAALFLGGWLACGVYVSTRTGDKYDLGCLLTYMGPIALCCFWAIELATQHKGEGE